MGYIGKVLCDAKRATKFAYRKTKEFIKNWLSVYGSGKSKYWAITSSFLLPGTAVAVYLYSSREAVDAIYAWMGNHLEILNLEHPFQYLRDRLSDPIVGEGPWVMPKHLLKVILLLLLLAVVFVLLFAEVIVVNAYLGLDKLFPAAFSSLMFGRLE